MSIAAVDEPVPIDPERLLAQTAWVRRLARSLARDQASADDLVQETFVAALRRPPVEAVDEPRLRAWFGFVLRNMAFRRTRGDARREERERRGAEEGRSESDERADELEELRAELFAHVKALPEPLRQAVLLRYFEELDSAEIARRLGVPDSTVRNRLRRALAELRERLERKHGGDWRNLCLFVVPAPGPAAAGGGAALAAGGGAWVVGGGAACVALALLWIFVTRATNGDTERSQLTALPIERSLAESNDRADPRDERRDHALPNPDATRASEAAALRILVSDHVDPPPAPRFDHGVIVHGAVSDESGQPIDGVMLRWTDAWGRIRTGGTEEGKYSTNSLAPGAQTVRLFGTACAEQTHDVTLAADQEVQRFDFRVQRTQLVPVYVLDEKGANLVLNGEVDYGRPCCAVAVVTRAPPPETMRVSYGDDVDNPDWRVMLVHVTRRQRAPVDTLGLVELHANSTAFVSLVHLGVVFATQRIDGVPERVTFRVDLAQLDQSTSRAPEGRDWTPHFHASAVEMPTAKPRPPPDGVPIHLQFLDDSARPVMALFRMIPLGGIENGHTWDSGAHADGRYDWELEPGRYVLQITGTRDDDNPKFTRVGALPRQVEISPTGTNEILVQLSPLRDVILRSTCPAEDWFRWEIRTRDDLPATSGTLIGHATKSIGLPAGRFVLRVREREDGRVAAEQEFEVGEGPLALELAR